MSPVPAEAKTLAEGQDSSQWPFAIALGHSHSRATGIPIPLSEAGG